MSTFDSDDLGTMGYFLPEDSQLRLKKLREYVEFLANLARPRTSDEEQEWTAEIRPGEVAICLELLEEQIAQVLDKLSWPAMRGDPAAVRRGDAEPEAMAPYAAEEGADSTGARYVFGVTLDQIDELDMLINMIRAHGDVVFANDDAEFADHTLSMVGHIIFCDAEKLRDIIRDMNGQRLGPAHGTRTGVREERATYHVLSARLPMASTSPIVRQLPTYQ